MDKFIEEQIDIIYSQIMRSALDSQRPVSIKEAKELLLNFLKQSLLDQQSKIKQDLLEIANKGELEELRREITNYFSNL